MLAECRPVKSAPKHACNFGNDGFVAECAEITAY